MRLTVHGEGRRVPREELADGRLVTAIIPRELGLTVAVLREDEPDIVDRQEVFGV